MKSANIGHKAKNLDGNLPHTEAVLAQAIMKEGINAGLPVPLNCIWYNMRVSDSELIEIPKVKGACYQPSVEDIGYKIFVHAVPHMTD